MILAISEAAAYDKIKVELRTARHICGRSAYFKRVKIGHVGLKYVNIFTLIFELCKLLCSCPITDNAKDNIALVSALEARSDLL